MKTAGYTGPGLPFAHALEQFARVEGRSTTPSMLPSRCWRFFATTGSNVPARSRGAAISTDSPFVATVLDQVPLRALPSDTTALSCVSQPK